MIDDTNQKKYTRGITDIDSREEHRHEKEKQGVHAGLSESVHCGRSRCKRKRIKEGHIHKDGADDSEDEQVAEDADIDRIKVSENTVPATLPLIADEAVAEQRMLLNPTQGGLQFHETDGR